MKYKIEYKEKYGDLDSYHDYVRLVHKVGKIDPYLAEVMTRQHDMPPGFIYADDLTSCFVWSAHPYVEQEQWERMRDVLKDDLNPKGLLKMTR